MGYGCFRRRLGFAKVDYMLFFRFQTVQKMFFGDKICCFRIQKSDQNTFKIS